MSDPLTNVAVPTEWPVSKAFEAAGNSGVDGAELARSRFQIGPKDGRPGIEVFSERVISGDAIALQFHGAPGFKLDWVGFCRGHGTLDFPTDALYDTLIPGDYEARLMFDDHYRVLAVSPVTIVADK